MQKYENLFVPSFLNDCPDDCGILEYSGTLSPFPKDATVGMAYIPFQQTIDPYEPEVALKNGTLFEQLDKPFKGRVVRK